jgi:hypothetical protein
LSSLGDPELEQRVYERAAESRPCSRNRPLSLASLARAALGSRCGECDFLHLCGHQAAMSYRSAQQDDRPWGGKPVIGACGLRQPRSAQHIVRSELSPDRAGCAPRTVGLT